MDTFLQETIFRVPIENIEIRATIMVLSFALEGII